MIKAIIFDCFGVVLTDALQEIRSELEQHNPRGAAEVSDIWRQTIEAHGPYESVNRLREY
jgi:hypothetical protein